MDAKKCSESKKNWLFGKKNASKRFVSTSTLRCKSSKYLLKGPIEFFNWAFVCSRLSKPKEFYNRAAFSWENRNPPKLQVKVKAMLIKPNHSDQATDCKISQLISTRRLS